MTPAPRARPPAETQEGTMIAAEPLRAGDECTVRLDARGHMIVYRRGDGDAGNWGLADRDYATGETVRLWEGEGRWL